MRRCAGTCRRSPVATSTFYSHLVPTAASSMEAEAQFTAVELLDMAIKQIDQLLAGSSGKAAANPSAPAAFNPAPAKPAAAKPAAAKPASAPAPAAPTPAPAAAAAPSACECAKRAGLWLLKSCIEWVAVFCKRKTHQVVFRSPCIAHRTATADNALLRPVHELHSPGNRRRCCCTL